MFAFCLSWVQCHPLETPLGLLSSVTTYIVYFAISCIKGVTISK